MLPTFYDSATISVKNMQLNKENMKIALKLDV